VISGEIDGLVDPDGPRVVLRRDGEALAAVEIPGAEDLGIRAHADTISVWSPDGRVVAIDLTTRAPVVDFTVRPA
jgi:hypothetical protein